MIKEELRRKIFDAIVNRSQLNATIDIISIAEQYASQRALEIAGEAFDAGKDYAAYLLNGRHGVYPDRETYLSNLKKKLDDKAQ